MAEEPRFRQRIFQEGGKTAPQMIGRFWKFLISKGSYFGYLGLALLVVIGLMTLVRTIAYLEPTDGAEWALEDDLITVTSIDLSADPSLHVGDVLVSIDSNPINSLEDYDKHLFESPIGSRRNYVVLRSGESYEPFVTIYGRKTPVEGYYLLAFTGFVYLIFLLLVLGQNVTFSSKRLLAVFSLCVYLVFVLQHTDRFVLLDWFNFVLDHMAAVLLPSALAGVALNQTFSRSKWLNFVQALHWGPTAVLLVLTIMEMGPLSSIIKKLDIVQLEGVRDLWSGSLIIAAVLVLALVAEIRSKERNFTLYWAAAWLPYALKLLHLKFPYDTHIAGLAPVILPLALLMEWRGRDEFHLGHIGKKVLVYIFTTLVLMLGFFLFIGLFHLLLGAKLGESGQTIFLGLGIMFASMSFGTLSDYAAEALDRMIYGKRFESIRILSDFSGINRADTNLDDFLHIIRSRIKNAFQVEKGLAYKVSDNETCFQTIAAIHPEAKFVFDELPPLLLKGEIVKGHQVQASGIDTEEPPFKPNDVICPIRVTHKLAALIVLTPQGNQLKLSPEEMRLLKSLLHQCDVLMENMELYHSVHQKVASINQLNEYNDNIIESSRVGILTTDDLGRTVSANSALAGLSGIEKKNIIGKTFEQVFKSKKVKVQRRVKSGFAMEGLFLNGVGEQLLLEIEKTPLRTKDNEVYGALYLIEDIRERKRMDEKLMQQEKLASIGLLAAGVAHEINTPLTGITSYSQMLGNDPSLDEDQKELLQLIQNQSQRAANIVSELLHFSRKESLPKGPVDLMEILDQTLRFLSHQMQKRKVRITVAAPQVPAIISGYPNQIQQVFLNLMVNAMDAMPDGGDIEVGASVGHSRIDMWFQDNGIGMDAKTQSHIFDPFFTTKEVGKGTGLGMAVVFKILQDHEAGIEVESAPDEGCRFTLQFFRLGEQSGVAWNDSQMEDTGKTLMP